MSIRDGKRLLTREDWARAALDAIGEGGGVDAVVVDRLAKAVGASRGSFYWHFGDRRELIAAALELWERECTSDIISELDAINDPVERLRELFRTVYEAPSDAVEITLAAAGDEPAVAPVVGRITALRLDLLRRIFSELRLDDTEADDRAWLAYAFYIGHHQLSANPETAPRRPADLGRTVALLTARPSPSSPSPRLPSSAD